MLNFAFEFFLEKLNFKRVACPHFRWNCLPTHYYNLRLAQPPLQPTLDNNIREVVCLHLPSTVAVPGLLSVRLARYLAVMGVVAHHHVVSAAVVLVSGDCAWGRAPADKGYIGGRGYREGGRMNQLSADAFGGWAGIQEAPGITDKYVTRF